jgi:hypothetical protein
VRRLILLAAVVAVLLAACGKSVIKADGAEKSVVEVVSSKTSFTPKDVKCPSGVEAKKGGTFDCTFTGPDAKYVAHMRIQSVKGSRVNFAIQTEPAK